MRSPVLSSLPLLALTLAEPLLAAEVRIREKNAARLAESLGVEVTLVQGLRERGLLWSDVRRLLLISRRAKVSPMDLLAQREAGLGWDEIARRSGVLPEGDGWDEELRTGVGLRDALRDPVRRERRRGAARP
jgi:hypothetical protein